MQIIYFMTDSSPLISYWNSSRWLAVGISWESEYRDRFQVALLQIPVGHTSNHWWLNYEAMSHAYLNYAELGKYSIALRAIDFRAGLRIFKAGFRAAEAKRVIVTVAVTETGSHKANKMLAKTAMVSKWLRGVSKMEWLCH